MRVRQPTGMRVGLNIISTRLVVCELILVRLLLLHELSLLLLLPHHVRCDGCHSRHCIILSSHLRLLSILIPVSIRVRLVHRVWRSAIIAEIIRINQISSSVDTRRTVKGVGQAIINSVVIIAG